MNVGRGSACFQSTRFITPPIRGHPTELLAADDFFYVPHVDYPFEMALNELRVDSKPSTVDGRFGREVTSADYRPVLRRSNSDENQALSFAEQRLNWDGNDAKLVDAY